MQNKVREFNKKAGDFASPLSLQARILDIQSELGELAKECLNCTCYGTKEFKLTDDLKMEYGDVLYSLLSLASELNISANECLQMALKKYQTRIDKKSTMGSSN